MEGYVDEWTIGCMDQWMNDRINECTDGWMNARIDGSIYEWMDQWMNDMMDECMDGLMNLRIYGWMHEWMDECTDGWMNECTNGWMNKLVCYFIRLKLRNSLIRHFFVAYTEILERIHLCPTWHWEIYYFGK